LSRLSNSMVKRYYRFHNQKDANNFLIGKILLLKILEAWNKGLTIDDLKFSATRRPFFNENFDFNISHSEEIVVCAAVEDCRIGIDIESIRDIQINEYKCVFSQDSWQKITHSKDKVLAFYRYWTLFESVLKADGAGLSKVRRLECLSHAKIRLDGFIWNTNKIDITPGYLCHMACSKPDVQIDVEEAIL